MFKFIIDFKIIFVYDEKYRLRGFGLFFLFVYGCPIFLVPFV